MNNEQIQILNRQNNCLKIMFEIKKSENKVFREGLSGEYIIYYVKENIIY